MALAPHLQPLLLSLRQQQQQPLLPHELALRQQQLANEQAQARNALIQAELRDLREGLEMVEEKARYELSMVRPDEIYVQVHR